MSAPEELNLYVGQDSLRVSAQPRWTERVAVHFSGLGHGDSVTISSPSFFLTPDAADEMAAALVKCAARQREFIAAKKIEAMREDAPASVAVSG